MAKKSITYAKHLELLSQQRRRYNRRQEKAILADRKRWEYRSIATVDFPTEKKLMCDASFISMCEMGRMFAYMDKQLGRIYGIDVFFDEKQKNPIKMRIDKMYLKEEE